MRFRVVVYGDTAFHGGTYDEVNSRISDHHRRRTKACGFRVDFSVKHYARGEMIPYSSGYAIVDNYDSSCSSPED